MEVKNKILWQPSYQGKRNLAGFFPQDRAGPTPMAGRGHVQSMPRPKKLMKELIEKDGENVSKEFQAIIAELFK